MSAEGLCRLGIDPGSQMAGLAYRVGDALVWTDTWKCPSRLKDRSDKILHYYEFLEERLLDHRIDEAAVEFATNVNYGGKRGGSQHTIRVLGWWESASALYLARVGVPVIKTEISATMARSELFRGHRKPTSKELAGERMRKLLPHHHFANDNEVDAAVLVYAAF